MDVKCLPLSNFSHLTKLCLWLVPYLPHSFKNLLINFISKKKFTSYFLWLLKFSNVSETMQVHTLSKD